MDKGHRESDERLQYLENRLRQEYVTAQKEIEEKANNFFKEYKTLGKENWEKVESGEWSKSKFNKWRHAQIVQGKKWKQLQESIASDIANVNQIARSIIDNTTYDVFADNLNFGTYEIEMSSRVNTSFALYNRDAIQYLLSENPDVLPVPRTIDASAGMRYTREQIQSVVMQSILQGESVDKTAERLAKKVGETNEKAAIRNARTMLTGAENGGREYAYRRAASMGIGIKKVWLATLDERTRDEHRQLDMQERELDEAFDNGLMFPGDTRGKPESWWNCRCRMVSQYDKYKTDFKAIRALNEIKGYESYEDWKRGRDTIDENAILEADESILEYLPIY